ncbi:hypothetical protein HMPREF9463_00597, partial [Collinsella sp. 4_8_47FAA]
ARVPDAGARAADGPSGTDASALMDAFGIEELAPGELDLTPGCIERARAARGEGPLAG